MSERMADDCDFNVGEVSLLGLQRRHSAYVSQLKVSNFVSEKTKMSSSLEILDDPEEMQRHLSQWTQGAKN